MRPAHELVPVPAWVPAQQPEQAQVSVPVPAWVPLQAVAPALRQTQVSELGRAVVPALQPEQVSVPEQPEPQRHSKHPPRQSPFRRAPSHQLARESR
ncbi:MAG: hypothetical protein RL352_913 [Actinomycetota bacterium]